ncbi:serine/threonine-protein kinase, partial [Nocardioides sp.]|uniref:serine/threonine-protein kinase n=1 Tax=Nocardioides sp. TaxID=35761 RepID=UPI002D805056
ARLVEEVGAPPFRVALDLVGQVAAGVADAHAAGLVHRDIKPANVLLRRRDGELTAYLADFGVACRVGAEPPSGEPGATGTPLWMAPEVWSGRPAGVAGDIYSLGCLLWATLTGRPPYAGATEERLAAAHREQPVPQLVGDSPMVLAVNRILLRSMAKEPAARYRTAAELRADLRHASTLSDVVRGRASSAPALRRLATAVALLATAGAAALSGVHDAPERSPGPAPGERARAVASLSAALADRGLMSRDDADCTARRWIAGAGLRTMVSAGFFDADLDFVDRAGSAATPRIERAATAAARACATER